MRTAASTIALVSAAALSAACGGHNRDSGFITPGSTGGSNHPDDAGTSGPEADASLLGTGDASTPAIALGCSLDQQSVVNATTGVLVETCPMGQGCSGGACMPACQAAAQNHGNIGCDFLVATPSFYAEDTEGSVYYSPCFAVFLTNNWDTPMAVTVDRGGVTYDVSQFARIPVAGMPETSWQTIPGAGVPPGEVAVLWLEHSDSTSFTCPVGPALNEATQVSGMGTGIGTGIAWHIATSAPVSAYDVLPYGGAPSLLPSAELLFPTSAWGKNYVTVVPLLGSGQNASLAGPQWAQILAVNDGTTVTIVPTVDLPSGDGVAGAAAHTSATYTLSAGEFIQWQAAYDFTNGSSPWEMGGSVIQSNNPIAFMSGNGYLCLGSSTSTGGGCDSGHQQIPPVSALGTRYAPAPYTTRRSDLQEESLPYRVVGMVAGTQLTYDPPVAGAPTTLALGQTADFEATGAFVVSSQDKDHPFYIGQMMTGCNVTSGSREANVCLGDEEFTNVMAPAQFLSSYVFFTDPTYETTTLTLVRIRGASGFADVTLDCISGPLSGWQPVGSSGQYEWTTVDIQRAGVGNGSCMNGPHSAKSANLFGLTVWGTANFASYGYPAGTNIAAINTVVVPPVAQ